MSTTRVLLADDQALVREGFRHIIDAREDLEVVGEASDGREAIALAAATHPHVILMDVRMPVLDGIEATRRLVDAGNPARIVILTTFDLDEAVFGALRAGASGFMLKDIRAAELVQAIRLVDAGNPARIVILTTFDLDEAVFGALRAGASGFMLKDIRAAELVQAIRLVARGEALLAPTVTRRLLDRFAEALPGTPPPALDELTAREVEVLRLVARAMSNAEIAERLTLTEATVKSHVSAILRKLGLRDRVQAVVAAYDAGLVRPHTS